MHPVPRSVLWLALSLALSLAWLAATVGHAQPAAPGAAMEDAAPIQDAPDVRITLGAAEVVMDYSAQTCRAAAWTSWVKRCELPRRA